MISMYREREVMEEEQVRTVNMLSHLAEEF